MVSEIDKEDRIKYNVLTLVNAFLSDGYSGHLNLQFNYALQADTIWFGLQELEPL